MQVGHRRAGNSKGRGVSRAPPLYPEMAEQLVRPETLGPKGQHHSMVLGCGGRDFSFETEIDLESSNPDHR